MAGTSASDPRALHDVFRRIAQQAVERELRSEPLEVRELRRLAPDSPVLRFFRKASTPGAA